MKQYSTLIRHFLKKKDSNCKGEGVGSFITKLITNYQLSLLPNLNM
jgi:hypothetical protein